MRAGAEFVNGFCGGDIQRAVVGIAPSKIRRLFRQNDGAEMMSGGIPDPDSLGPGDIEIAVAIQLHAVGNTALGGAGFAGKDATVAQGTIGMEIVDADIALIAVVDIKLLAVRRKSQAVGLREVLREKADFAFGAEAIDALEGDFLFFVGRQIQGWIGEIDGAIRTEDDIVRAVEALAFEVVGENLIPAGRVQCE